MNLLGGIYGYLGAAALAALVTAGATYYVTSEGYKLTIANLHTQIEHKNAVDIGASLDQLKKAITVMTAAGTAHQEDIAALTAKLDKITAEFRNAIKASPLPADCLPTVERMRALDSAIAAANAAAAGTGFGETVRNPH
jgi:hypothetical protein